MDFGELRGLPGSGRGQAFGSVLVSPGSDLGSALRNVPGLGNSFDAPRPPDENGGRGGHHDVFL